MTQRVPSAGFYDTIVEDHSYTMFSMYPPNPNLSDPWQPSKPDGVMVRETIQLHEYYFQHAFTRVKGRIVEIRKSVGTQTN